MTSRRLHSGAPFWLVRDGMREEEPRAPRRGRYDVVVVGAGVTGALIADALAAEGLSVLIVDRGAPATGSTAASTALLQYELDAELHDLVAKIGEADAVRAYHLCAEAIDTLEALARELGASCDFARRPSLYLATHRRDVRRLEAEAEVRARVGLDATFWDREQLRSQYTFPAHAALRSDTAAVIDPVRVTHALLDRARARGAESLGRTAVAHWESVPRGVLVRTSRGSVEAGHLVLAVGYELPAGVPRDVVSLRDTFAIVTEPVDEVDGWGDRCLAWETARPYAYLRGTPDGRIMMGGMDTAFRDPARRERLLAARGRALARQLKRWLPCAPVDVAFRWAGSFAETDDGLPLIGALPGAPRVLYALGYGGNGITFGVVGRRLITDHCLGVPNEDARIFRLDR